MSDYRLAYLISAHLSSLRYPNKVFVNLLEKPILKWVIDAVLGAVPREDIYVVSPDDKILDYALKYCGVFKVGDLTCGSHATWPFWKSIIRYDGVVTIPSDEPLLMSKEIKKLDKFLKSESIEDNIITTYCDFYNLADLADHTSCKIVADSDDYVLYFSREVIPSAKGGLDLTNPKILSRFKKHVGIFAFSNSILRDWKEKLWTFKSPLTDWEGLEQNRFLELGASVKLFKIKHIGIGLDEPHQLSILEKRFTRSL